MPRILFRLNAAFKASLDAYNINDKTMPDWSNIKWGIQQEWEGENESIQWQDSASWKDLNEKEKLSDISFNLIPYAYTYEGYWLLI